MPDQDLAQLLRAARERRGESLRSAARELGVAPSHLSRVEAGDRQLSDEMRRRANRYYGISDDIADLAAGEVPSDVVDILRRHPELIEQLRARYGAQ
jgi:transcriptional regulator with XRE-family HTH domain